MKETNRLKKTEDKSITGTINEVIEPIDRSLKIFMAKYRDVKVGITGREPQVRFNEHLSAKPSWERMVVKYQSTSQRYVNTLEDYFIDEYPTLKNDWYGTSLLSEKGPNYFYILLGRKKIKR